MHILDKFYEKGGITRLEGFKKITLSGEGAHSFLERQTTNKISKEDLHFNIHCLLNIGGKIEGTFLAAKLNADIILLSDSKLSEIIIKRLDQFIIMEELDFTTSDTSYFACIGAISWELRNNSSYIFDELGFPLHFFDVDEASKLDSLELEDSLFSTIDELRALYRFNGVELDLDIYQGKLLSNTRLFELAWDRGKGCFLGQETLGKIDSNRGAAKNEALIKLASDDNAEFSFKGCLYKQESLGRSERVEKLAVAGGIVNLIPLIDISTKKLYSRYLYDIALEDYMENDRVDSSINRLLRCLQFDDGFEDAIEMLGVLYGRKNQFNQAISVMQSLLDKNPDQFMAHTNLSLFYMRQKNLTLAEEHKAKAEEIKKKINNSEVDSNSVDSEMREREKMFLQVLEIDEEDDIANYGMAEISFKRESFQKSITHLKKVQSTNPKHSLSYLLLGQCFLRMNKKIEAKNILEQGLKVSTSNGDMVPANKIQELLSTL